MQPMRVGAIAPNQSLPTAGPKRRTGIVVGAGAYTSITTVYGPSQAGSGETVHIQVVAKNLYSSSIYLAITGAYDGQEMFAFNPEYATVGAGGSYTFTNAFVMPNKNITLDIWSWYWSGSEWIQDDHKAVSIKRIYVWIPLASTSLRVEVAPIGAWIPLASTSLRVTVAPIGAWIALASATLSVKKAPIGAWIALASGTLSVKKAPIGAWIALASTSLPVAVAAVGGWVPLASTTLAVQMGIVGGWVPLAEDSADVVVGIVEGKDIFKSLAVDFEKKMPKEFEETT